jgi:PAS domain S-box-containing protein
MENTPPSQIKAKNKHILKKLTEVKEILNLTDVIIINLNLRNEIVFVNKKGLDFLGYETLTGQNWIDTFVIPEKRVKIKRLLEEFKGKKTFEKRNLLIPTITRHKEKKYIKWSFRPLRNEKKIIGLLLTGKNYTKRHDIEEKLNISRKKFKKTFENASEPIIWANAETGEIINCNRMTEKLFERRKEELIGMHQSKLHPPDEKIFYENLFKKFADKTTKFEAEAKIITKSGKIIPTRISGYLTEIEDNKVVVGIFHNITEEKATEQALEEMEEIYKNISEQSLVGVAINQEDRIVYANSYGASIFGLARREALKIKLSEVFNNYVYPDDLELVKKNFQLLRTNQKKSVNFQNRIIIQEGEIIWIENLAKIIRYQGNLAILIIFIDITDRKTIQEQLKNSEEKYRILFQKSPESIILSTIQGTVIDVNPASEIIFDLSRDEIIGEHFSESARFTEKQIKLFAERTKNLLRDIKQEPLELMIKKLNGETAWISFDMALIDLQGKKMLITMIQDITERKKVLQQLKESENKYRTLFESSIDGIAMTNLKGRIIDCNQAFINMLGYRKERLKNLTYFDITPKKWHKKETEIIEKQVMVRGYSDEYEKEYIRKDGIIIPISIKTWLVTDNEGNPTGMWAIVRDITEKKRAERKLKESELKYRHIFENSPYSISLLTLDGKLIDTNEATNMLLTIMDTSDIIGKNYRDFFSVDEKDKDLIKLFDKQFEQVIEQEKPSSFEFRIHKTLDGGYFWVNAHISLIKIGKKRLIQLIIQDQTDIKIANKKIKKSERKYKEAYSRSNFYKDLFAHDINNILQNIQAFIDLISMKIQELEEIGDLDEILTIVREQVIRGAKLVSNVRILSEIEEKKIELEELDLISNLQNSINYIKNIFKQKDIDINLNYHTNLLYVQANDLIRNVFDNILINAVRHNENQKIEIEIDISESVFYGQNFAKIEFKDNAKGIPNEMKNLIFRRGYSNRDAVKGLGLGLSLVKKIIEIYDGQIWVENRVKENHKEGSNFVLLIPKVKTK